MLCGEKTKKYLVLKVRKLETQRAGERDSVFYRENETLDGETAT